MKNRSQGLLIAVASMSFIFSSSYAATNVGTYDASLGTAPTSQGWVDNTSQTGNGSIISDLGFDAWQADGMGGRAVWQIVPTTTNNTDASANGWTMSWTSRVVSGSYVTDYYGNNSKRFLPVLSINANGDLIATLEGGGTHTLVSGTGANEYHDYNITYNSTTGTASFSFDGNIIETGWAGAASGNNTITFGNGSSNTDSVANYRKVSFDIADPQPIALPNVVSENDTSNLVFDGATQFSDISSQLQSLSSLNQGSIFTTFKASGTTATIFSASNATEGSSEFTLLINSDGTLKVHARENGTFVNQTATTTGYSDNLLHKAALVVDNTGTKIYVDGKLAASSNSTAFFNSVDGLDSINIGRNIDNGGGQWYFTGEINETKVFDGPLSEFHATSLTALTTLIGSYDSVLGDTPTAQGWIDDSTLSGSGNLIQDMGQNAWQAVGTGGKAEWEFTPSASTNIDASNNGWRMTIVARVVSGSSITNYYANGSKRFLPSLSLNSQGELIVELEGGGTHTLSTGTEATNYHTYTVTYNPVTTQATFSFNGTAIETWSGSSTSQNIVVWGNGSSGTNGIANYRNIKFETFDAAAQLPYFSSDVFVGGAEGINGMSNYRIPSFVQAQDGSLLAFIEGRPHGGDPGQSGQINISLKRSTDNGRTWQPVQIIHEDSSYDYSDPRPVVDQTNGDVYVFYVQWPDLCAQNGDCVDSTMANYLFYRKSTDHGVTWEAPVNISSQVKDPTWRSINPGPGQAIQLHWQTAAQGNHNDRLIFPAIVRAGDSKFYVSSIYSDDNGASWSAGPLTPTDGPTEADVVELSDGKILLSARNDSSKAGTRYHFISSDGGVNWTQTVHDLSISKVDIGLTRFSAVRSGDPTDRILLSGPIGNPVGTNRNNLGVWISNDEGTTFGSPHQLIFGFSAYSDILKMQDGTIGILYEATGSTYIRFLNVDITTLEGL